MVDYTLPSRANTPFTSLRVQTSNHHMQLRIRQLTLQHLNLNQEWWEGPVGSEGVLARPWGGSWGYKIIWSGSGG